MKRNYPLKISQVIEELFRDNDMEETVLMHRGGRGDMCAHSLRRGAPGAVHAAYRPHFGPEPCCRSRRYQRN